MNRIQAFSCLASENNGFKLDVSQDADTHEYVGELTRIENYLPPQNDDSNSLPLTRYHDPENIVGDTVDKVVEKAKSKIQDLGFQVLQWMEEPG